MIGCDGGGGCEDGLLVKNRCKPKAEEGGSASGAVDLLLAEEDTVDGNDCLERFRLGSTDKEAFFAFLWEVYCLWETLLVVSVKCRLGVCLFLATAAVDRGCFRLYEEERDCFGLFARS